MLLMRWIAICALAGFISTIALADESAVNPELTAAQIIEKNADARGGKEAWRKIQTIVWLGHVKNSGTPEMPYALELKRPNKTRFEIKAQNQKFIRIFDGINGWKIKPSSDGRPQLQPYSAEDLSAAKDGVRTMRPRVLLSPWLALTRLRDAMPIG